MTERQTGTLSRRKLIVVAGGSVVAAPLLSSCGSDSASGEGGDIAEFGKGDVGILNYALTVEHVQADFYATVAEGDLLDAAELKMLGKFGEEEDEHIASLTKEVKKLGGKPVVKPATEFALDGKSDALEVASELENVGAAAYLGQLPRIRSATVLKTVLSIHSVEGRHAAAVNDLLEGEITPNGAFAEPATVDSVLSAIDSYMA